MDRLTILDSSRLYREALGAYLAMRFPGLPLEKQEIEGLHSRIDMNGAPLFVFHRDILNAQDIARQIEKALVRAGHAHAPADPFARVTRREREVMGWLAKGYTNKQIALALSLQEVTVKLHVRGICRKLGVQNRTQAALMAQENLVE